MSKVMIAKVDLIDDRKCHDLEEMIKDIKINGLEEPIVVTKFGNGFVLVDGLRRFCAYKFLGHTHIPVVIKDD